MPVSKEALDEVALSEQEYQLIVDKLLKGQGVISQGPIIPVTSYYNPKIEGLFPYDVEKAKALLKEAGWDANREIALFFSPGEILDCSRSIDRWIF